MFWKSISVSVLSLFLFHGCASPNPLADSSKDPEKIAAEAYLYAYPLVMSSAYAERLPKGYLIRSHTLPTAASRVFPFQNPDVLYASSWLDLSQSTYELEIPSANDRFFIFVLNDAWMNVVASASSQTLPHKSRKIFLAGPQFSGPAPKGFELWRSKTSLAWLLGRVQVRKKSDLKRAVAYIDGIKLRRTQPGTDSFTPFKESIKPQQEVDRLRPIDFFRRFSKLWIENPPGQSDREFIGRVSKIGLRPGEMFEPDKLDKKTFSAIANAPANANELLKAERNDLGSRFTGGWYLPKPGEPRVGDFGNHYLFRALTAKIAPGCFLPEDAVLVFGALDSERRPLEGSHEYLIRFEKNRLPPVDAFWSITVYDEAGFLVSEVSGISLTNETISIRSSDPFAEISLAPSRNSNRNWIATPRTGVFTVVMRLFSPRKEVLSGEWTPPPILRSEKNETL
jgi:hypothetical protein